LPCTNFLCGDIDTQLLSFDKGDESLTPLTNSNSRSQSTSETQVTDAVIGTTDVEFVGVVSKSVDKVGDKDVLPDTATILNTIITNTLSQTPPAELPSLNIVTTMPKNVL